MLTKEEVIELCEVVYNGNSSGMIKVYQKKIKDAEDRKDTRQSNLFKENLISILEVYKPKSH